MAIRKRQSLKEPLRVVSVYDDAIDWAQTPRYDYVTTRDAALLKYLPGKETSAVVFTLRNLPTPLVNELRTRPSPRREEAFFTWACVSCSEPGLLEFEGHGDERHVSVRSLDVLPPYIIEELGGVADSFCSLSVGEKKAYRLPLGLPAIPTPQPSTTVNVAAPNE